VSSACSCGNGLCEDCARDMRAAILAVRQLHRPIKPHPRGLEVCAACSDLKRYRDPMRGKTFTDDHRAGVAHPCATIQTLDAKGV
jgi:hypothetical protein